MIDLRFKLSQLFSRPVPIYVIDLDDEEWGPSVEIYGEAKSVQFFKDGHFVIHTGINRFSSGNYFNTRSEFNKVKGKGKVWTTNQRLAKAIEKELLSNGC